MAISPTNLLAAGTKDDASSFDTASISPAADRLLILFVNASHATDQQPPAPTVTGGGVTWTWFATFDHDTSGTGDRGSCHAFYALTGASPGSGAITIDFSGLTLNACSWIVDSWSGVVLSAAAIVQSKTAVLASAGTSVSVTLDSSFADATNNAAVGYHGREISSGTTTTVGDGFNKVGEVGTIKAQSMSEWKTGEDTTVDASWTPSARAGILGIELQVAAAATIPSLVMAPPLAA